MLLGMPSLSHQEQQDAVDRIHMLMEKGISSGEAIALVAQEIRDMRPQQQVRIFEDTED